MNDSNTRRRRRRPICFFLARKLAVLLMAIMTCYCCCCCTAFVTRPPLFRGRTSARPARIHLYVASSSQQALEDMTVKELRQLLKDANLQERGLLSKLKRKSDLVEYLSQHLPKEIGVIKMEAHDATGNTSPPRSNHIQPKIPQTPRRGAPLHMPPHTTKTTASLKDVLFEQIYQRYPTLKRSDDDSNNNNTTIDVRQLYHPMLQNASTSDMDLIFVGTASCTPSATRGVSCTALRLNWRRRCLPTLDANHKMPGYSSFTGGTWLFDVGECTQLLIQRTSSVKPGKITKIFITHAHGDHSFGLPGLLCLMGQDRDRDAPPVEIYGPEGLRMWLRVAIRYSVSRIVPPYRVHELMDIPMAPEWEHSRRSNRYYYRIGAPNRPWRAQGMAGEDRDSWITQCNRINLPLSSQFGEIERGRDIFPIQNHPLAYDGAPVWEVEDEDDVKVYAAPMSHGVPCVGYVVEEQSRPGRLRNEYVEPIVRRNLKALKESGFNIPMKAMAVIKNLPEGSSFSFPDGTVVSQEDAVEPERNGRKIVICGDTADARALTNLAQHADVLVHEATNTYLPGVDKDTDLKAVTKDAVLHGHSTPYIAGGFAKKIKAKRLLMNHFSARYKGDAVIESISLMTRMEGQGMKASSFNEMQVAAAWDLMVLPVPQN